MKRVLFCFGLSCMCLAFADNASSAGQVMQQKYQQLIEVDEQIENVVKERMQLQVEAAEHMERGDTAILPGVERRQSDAVSELAQQIQAYNQQLQALESKRSQILLSMQ